MSANAIAPASPAPTPPWTEIASVAAVRWSSSATFRWPIGFTSPTSTLPTVAEALPVTLFVPTALLMVRAEWVVTSTPPPAW